MELLLKIVFILNFSFILVHEMDAIRNKEWKMFIYLKDLEENKAYKIFTLLHLPIYAVFLFLFLNYFGNCKLTFYIVLDLFLIFHMGIHYFFRKHKEDKFKSRFSKFIIYFMGFLSVIHLIGLFL